MSRSTSCGDERRLVVLVVGDVADDLLAVAGVGPQPLVLAALVLGDDGVGGGEDRLRRAVVLLEQHDLGVREVLLELEDVADVGAAEGVDRLVGVADDAQLGGRDGRRRPALAAGGGADELAHQRVLRVVGVLVLVDEHVPEAPPVVLGDVGEDLQQVDGLHDQVVEVHGVGLRAAAPGRAGRPRRPASRVSLAAWSRARLGVDELVLEVADLVAQRARRKALGVEVEVAADQGHQPLRVGRRRRSRSCW